MVDDMMVDDIYHLNTLHSAVQQQGASGSQSQPTIASVMGAGIKINVVTLSAKIVSGTTNSLTRDDVGTIRILDDSLFITCIFLNTFIAN